MTENDYIAEYIKEERPEIISGLDFAAWRLTKTMHIVAEQLKEGLEKAFEGVNNGMV